MNTFNGSLIFCAKINAAIDSAPQGSASLRTRPGRAHTHINDTKTHMHARPSEVWWAEQREKESWQESLKCWTYFILKNNLKKRFWEAKNVSSFII